MRRAPRNAEQLPRITVLNDAFSKDPAMTKDWGYAAFIEVAGRRILFDTGNSGEVLAANAAVKGVDLRQLDFAVVSHRHGDHMGGLAQVLAVNPTLKVYAPDEPFGVFGSELAATFPRADDSLAPHERYFDGNREGMWKTGSAWPGADFQLMKATADIAPGITVIALVSDRPGTVELRELSLAIDTPDGVVLVVGCSHPGIANIVEAAQTINSEILCVAGGLHLLVAGDDEITRTVALLHDVYQVEYVAPGHCTGEPTLTALKRTFGECCLYAGLGSRLSLDGSSASAA